MNSALRGEWMTYGQGFILHHWQHAQDGDSGASWCGVQGVAQRGWAFCMRMCGSHIAPIIFSTTSNSCAKLSFKRLKHTMLASSAG